MHDLAALLDVLRERLSRFADAQGNGVQVALERGSLVLNGRVATPQVRDDVEAIVRAACGNSVSDIQNRLDVERSETAFPR